MDAVREPAIKTRARIGWVLLAAALATPTLMGAAGLITSFKAGEFTVQVGFSWLVAAVVSDLILRKWGSDTKAKGRIVAATLALVMALTVGIGEYRDTKKVDTAKKELIEDFMSTTVAAQKSAAQPLTPDPASAVEAKVAATPAPIAVPIGASDTDRAVAVLGQMKVQVKKMAAEFVALDQKFRANDLGASLKAENLVTREGIQFSRKKVENLKVLINQRNAILQQHYANTESIIRNSGTSEREIANGLAGMEAGKGNTQRLYQELGNAQMNSLKSINDLLNFAERNLGRITAPNGQVLFQTQPELDEYQRLMAALTELSAREDEITQRVQADAQQHRQNVLDEYKK